MAARGTSVFLLGLIACLCPIAAAGASSAEVRAGVGRETFALPAKVPLAGYSRRKGRPSTGVHDPVGARALVLRDAQTTAVLVSCDLLIVDERLFDAVRRRLVSRGIPPEAVLVVAGTHTHSGPGAYGARFFEKLSMGHADPAVFEELVRAITEAVVRAHDTLEPVRMAFRAAPTEGLVYNRVEAEGPVDAELVVIGLFRDSTHEPLAIIVNFAAHPTTLGAWNRQVSADYPGVIMRELEARFPTATCLFFAGAAADQGPVKTGEGFERAERIGLPLARQAAALLEAARVEPAETVTARQRAVELPPAEVRLGRWAVPRWLGARFVDDDATLSVVLLGRTAVFGVPCDLAASLGADLKAAARAHHLQPVIAGFANDYVGYCVPEALYRAKQYESSMAFNGPKAGELLVDHLQDMLDQIVTHDRSE